MPPTLLLKAACKLLEARGYNVNHRLMKREAKLGKLKAMMVTPPEGLRPYYVTTEDDLMAWAKDHNWRQKPKAATNRDGRKKEAGE